MTDIDDLAAIVRAGLTQDEHYAREACGGTVVGEPGNWRQAPGGDEWEAGESPDGDIELLVALRPGLPRPPESMSGYWGAVVSWRDDDHFDEPGVRGPLDAFRHAARWDPRRVLTEVASKRALLDTLLAEKHHVCIDQYYTCRAATVERDGGVYGEGDQPGPCDCGRDERVHRYLQLLAQPYQEQP